MMDSPTHSYMHFSWLELLEIGLFILLTLFALSVFIHITVDLSSKIMKITTWKETPELLLLTLALPLQLLWEIAQFPLYTIWHEGDWSNILYMLIHCTLGDLLILLCVFWLISLLNRSRTWIFSPSLINIVLFTVLGLSYTVFSEIINTGIKGTWEYTELMPIVPVIEIGGMPFLQWLLIPPVLIWLIQIVRPAQIK
jgi:hypothetical protein